MVVEQQRRRTKDLVDWKRGSAILHELGILWIIFPCIPEKNDKK
jgi:hypothetical protein